MRGQPVRERATGVRRRIKVTVRVYSGGSSPGRNGNSRAPPANDEPLPTSLLSSVSALNSVPTGIDPCMGEVEMSRKMKRFLLAALASLLAVMGAAMVVSAYSASSGDQAFFHNTWYFPDNTRYYFTSHSGATTYYEYPNGSTTRLTDHNIGTSVTNGKYYPFAFSVADPHIYYSSSQYSFDLTSGYFSRGQSWCNTTDVCATYVSSEDRDFDRSAISADGEIFVYTSVGTAPTQHHDDLSAYSFQ